MTKIKTLSILGPTASGKTGLAIALAKKLDGEVVSISPVPNEEGNYVVEIRLTRMSNKQTPVLKVMNGTAEIIVREQSLLERIFNY